MTLDLFAEADRHDAGGKSRLRLPPGWSSSAVFGGDLQCYRYRLDRWIEAKPRGPFLAWVLCNPSVADEHVDDPTLGRVRSFTLREGLGGYTVLNLCAFRATKPGDLLNAADPVGPRNAEVVQQAISDPLCGGVVVGWGAAIPGALLGAVSPIVASLMRRGGLQCLGTVRAGAPRHPLYVAGDEPLRAWP